MRNKDSESELLKSARHQIKKLFCRRMHRPLSLSKRYNGARSFGDDDSDVEPPLKRRQGHNQVIQDVLERHKANNTKRLNEASERAEWQHAELLQAQTVTSPISPPKYRVCDRIIVPMRMEPPAPLRSSPK
jgi:hypothetical protein